MIITIILIMDLKGKITLTFLLLSALFDCITTYLGLQRGLVEGNQTMEMLFTEIGIIEVMIFKCFATFSLGYVLMRFTFKRNWIEYVWTLCCLWFWIVFSMIIGIHNLTL